MKRPCGRIELPSRQPPHRPSPAPGAGSKQEVGDGTSVARWEDAPRHEPGNAGAGQRIRPRCCLGRRCSASASANRGCSHRSPGTAKAAQRVLRTTNRIMAVSRRPKNRRPCRKPTADTGWCGQGRPPQPPQPRLFSLYLLAHLQTWQPGAAATAAAAAAAEEEVGGDGRRGNWVRRDLL